jgi:ribonuclease R
MSAKDGKNGVPETEDMLRFIGESDTPVSKRELARAFGIKGDDRIPFKAMLRELEGQGLILKLPGQEYTLPGGLPAVSIIEVTGTDIDGDLFARPVDWNAELQGEVPRILVAPDPKGHPSLAQGDRVLARLNRTGKNEYEAKTIRRLDTPRGRIMGVVAMQKRGAVLRPADKRAKVDFDIDPGDLNGAKDGDMALGEIKPAHGRAGKKIRIIEVIGHRTDRKAISLISMHEMGIRPEFPDKVLRATNSMKVPPLGKREDLRGVPLVTIDGADARDFDDAVFAEKTDDGFHLIVAIADVAYYVRPESALDSEAYRRGNSTYFPDRVVPMLPVALSNDLCSLRPAEPRACMAVHMYIDYDGRLTGHKFVRGLMRSQARLTYEQVQAAMDGTPDDTTDPLLDGVIRPLYAAFAVLDRARMARGALALDLPERKIDIDENNMMTGVSTRTRLDSHKLIEEFMVLANVAAATALEKRKAPCIYRVHDSPALEKLDAAREFISAFGLSLPKGQVIRPAQLNQVLLKAAGHPQSHLISEVVLRSQSQAVYAPDNIGHYGLALARYAHFTSPIRRYADLVVHRSLIRALGLGEGGLDEGEEARLEEICGHVSATERTSMEAERNAVDRFTAAYLSEKIGAEFAGRIRGVTRFGLFVELEETGADGFVPMRSLPDDYYIHDEERHALIGRRTGRVYRMGAQLTVRLREADPLTGSTILQVVGDRGADIPGMEITARKSGKKNSGKKRGKPSGHGGKKYGRGKGGKKR